MLMSVLVALSRLVCREELWGAAPDLDPQGPGTPRRGVLDVLIPRRGMVITRVMYYKCKAQPRTYHYMTFVIKYI